jgi:hypothetical protein
MAPRILAPSNCDTGVKVPRSKRAFARILVSAAVLATPLLPAAAQSGDPSVCRGSAGYAQTGGGSTYLWRPEWLSAQRAWVRADQRQSDRWQRAAEVALTRPQRSVVDKSRIAASGDRHDYHSIGPYWWPTPGAVDGMPYVRRDGEVNPERSGPEFDHASLQQLSRDIRTLALAYHHLGDRRYAVQAGALVRLWFLDPATRMNPNFNYAQAIPGANSGRAEGLIEAIALTDIIESVGVIAAADALNESDQAALRGWFGELAQWMASSDIGQEERRATNNHGLYFDYLISHFALFAGREPVVTDIVSAFPEQRLSMQMTVDGRFPAELERTRPFHYSLFALDAAGRLGALGACVNRNLWQAQAPAGQSLARGIGWLGPFIARPNDWQRTDSDFADPRRRTRELADAQQVLRFFQWAGLGRDIQITPTGEDRIGDLTIPPLAQQ